MISRQEKCGNACSRRLRPISAILAYSNLRDHMRSFDEFISHLGSVDFKPSTVIDVGVAWGTPILYETFPEADLILVEALPYFEDHLKNILQSRRGRYHLCGVSDQNGSARITVREDALALAGTSLLHSNTGGDLTYDVSIRRLDQLITINDFSGPVLLKTDIQGLDINALKSAEGFMSQVDVVVSEANIQGSVNLAADIVIYMNSVGFDLYEICGGAYRSSDNSLGQVDLAFARPQSILMANRPW